VPIVAAPPTALAAPGKTLAAPGKTLATPGKTLAAPGKTLAAPGKTLAAPGKTLAAPDKTLATPGKTLAAPGKTLAAPGKTLAAPGKVLPSVAKAPVAAAPAAGPAPGGCFCFPLPFFSMRKLLTNFDNVPKMEVGPQAQNCLTSLTGNPRYPKAKPQADALLAALTPYLAAASIQHPTPTQTAELAQLRTALNQALTAVATLANGLYPDDEAALLSTGLSLSKAPERHTTLEAPLRFQLVDGPQPGTLCAKAKRPPHSVALKYLYTLDPTEPDIEWYTVVVRDGDALLTRCQSADRVYCKVAAVGGDTDQQPYTDVLSRLVQ
jgi:hypothetical protein